MSKELKKLLEKFIQWIKSWFTKPTKKEVDEFADYEEIPMETDLVFHENFSGDGINSELWKTRMTWGIIHPKRPWIYSDPSCVNLKDGLLELSVKYAPKEITHQGFKYNPTYARGVLESVIKYGKGKYQFRCNIPENSWCAVWLYGGGDEIDIMEASRKEGFTFGTHLHFNNYEYRTDSYHKTHHGFHDFELIWGDDMVFKMDGKIIRVVKDVEISTEQYLVLSMGMHEDSQLNKPMLVDYISYSAEYKR